MSNTTQTSLVNHRHRGTILIMVCGLLVLLAILGVAWLSTTRIDRYASVQHTANTQIELLVDGVRSLSMGPIIDGLFGRTNAGSPNYYRPRSDGATAYDYAHLVSFLRDPAYGPLDRRNHPFLAARVPEVNTGQIVWRAVSAIGNASFESPLNGTTLAAGNRYDVAVGSMTLNGRPVPALTVGGVTLMAADADGDGIADSFLWPLPAAELNGVKYYAAVRVVDNNSAVHVGIASKFNDDYAVYPGGLAGNFFPTNVNLLGLLVGGASELTELNRFRCGNAGATWNPVPIDDAGANRDDFNFMSPYDAMWHQLGRRLGNPGYNVSGQKYATAGVSDHIALAYRFILKNPTGSISNVERRMPQSLLTPAPMAPYQASDITGWYGSFDYSTGTYSRRAILVGNNPVSNQITPALLNGPGTTGAAGAPMADFQTATKASINTATFGELYRAMWNVMVENAGGGTWSTPFDAIIASVGVPSDPYHGGKFGDATATPPFAAVATEPHPARMFRSSLRDPRTPFGAGTARLDARQMLLLRSAMAAVNTLNLREPGNNHRATPESVTLQASVNGTSGAVNVTLFGAKRQPYITEVFAHTDVLSGYGSDPTLNNPGGYVAIELHNPYDTPMSLAGFRLAAIDRKSGGGYPALTMTPVADFADAAQVIGATLAIPAGGYVLLENYRVGLDYGVHANAARYRPASASSAAVPQVDPAGGPLAGSIYVKDLHTVLDKELVILRPLAEGDITRPMDINAMVPVDQFDFTGLVLPAATANPLVVSAWHYGRGSNVASGKGWQFVYPGRYDGGKTSRRHQGTQEATWNLTAAETDPWAAAPPVPGVSLLADAAAGNFSATYPNVFTIQVANKDVAGANAFSGAGGNRFPFGAFARSGDFLHVPYIGAYRVTTTGGALLEINSITMDSVFAEDTDVTDDAAEQIGRFCPIASAGPPLVDDLHRGGTYDDADGAKPTKWRYRWAIDLFDYVTVQAPHDDYLPNTDPSKYLPAPQGVANFDSARVNRGGAPNEDFVGVEGLVNLNTAPWKVIAALPMVPGNPALNDQLAQAIVDARNANGPLQTLFELNKVISSTPGLRFQNAMGTLPADADDGDGDISPAGQGVTDGVRDFEEQFLVLNRISNLVTLRSDSFTVYLQVQGWRGAGTASPELAVERRVAYVIDRTPVTATNRTPRVYNVPQE